MFSELVKIRFLMIKNFFKHFKVHWWFTLFLIILVFFMIVGGGYFVFYYLFNFLEKQDIFGPLLTNLLVNMINLIFFVMLIFSNLIIILSTAYLSKETSYLFSYPFTAREIFFIKFLETVFFSSWAFVLMSIPVYSSLFHVRHISFYRIFLIIPPLILYVFIPAVFASIVSIIVTFIIPPRQSQKAFILLILIGIFISIFLYKFLGLRELIYTSIYGNFQKLIEILNLGMNPLLPNTWYSKTLYASMNLDFREYFFYLWMLLITGLFMGYILFNISNTGYYIGWLKTQEHNLTRPLIMIEEKIKFENKPPLISLVIKDFIIFFRDPTQWIQILIFLGIVMVYLVNLGKFPYSKVIKYWNEAIICFNIAASNFVLSIITTRFIYPQISLEGQQFWILSLAPIKKTLIIWEKILSALGITLAFSFIIVTVSNIILKTTTEIKILSGIISFIVTSGLTLIAISMGTFTANFKETNAAKIANGSGGTLNVILSLLYLAINLFFSIKIIFSFLTANIYYLHSIYFYIFILGNILFFYVLLRLTLTYWDKMEF